MDEPQLVQTVSFLPPSCHLDERGHPSVLSNGSPGEVGFPCLLREGNGQK